MSDNNYLKMRSVSGKNKKIGNVLPTVDADGSSYGPIAYACSWLLWFIFISYILVTLGFFWSLLLDIDQDVDHIEEQNEHIINTTDWIHMQTTQINETTIQILIQTTEILNNTNCSICDKLDTIIDIITPGHPSPFCNDDNPCTADIIKFGICRHFDKPNLTPCFDHCLDPGSHCFAGHCTGHCKGTCVFSADCPTITSFFPLTKSCLFGACVYEHVVVVPTIYNNSCFEESDILKQVCNVGLTDPKKDCLDIEVQCDEGNNMTCFHHFDCSRLHLIL